MHSLAQKRESGPHVQQRPADDAALGIPRDTLVNTLAGDEAQYAHSQTQVCRAATTALCP